MAGKPTFSLGSRSGHLIIAGCVLGALIVIYGALEAYAGGGVPRGTVVGEIAIGGLSRSEAEAALAGAFVGGDSSQFRVRVGEREYRLPVVARAVRVDVAATLDQIGRDRWNPLALLSLMRGEAVPPVVSVDRATLVSAVTALSDATATPAVDAAIDMTTDTPSVVPARAGIALDVEESVQAIVDAVVMGRHEVTLTRTEKAAVISTLVAQRAIDQVALPGISESVTVRLTMPDGTARTSVIRPGTIRAALSFVPAGSLLQPHLDGLVLRRDLDAAIFDVQRFAKRAKFRISGESITVVPSIEGYGVTAMTLANDVAKVLGHTGPDRIVSPQLGTITPDFTTEEAQALGITELVSSYRQEFPAAAYRTINIGTAAKYINGTILLPGETFSMNDTVKERTVENGYTSGWIIGPGGVFKNEMGGAVSTITTAVYNAAWFGGLKLVEHRAHSIYISRYKPGREATVSWGDFDMKFSNNLEHAILITTKLRRTSISVYFWGTREWQDIGSEFGPWTNQTPYPEFRITDPECHDQDGMPGFRITVWRTFYENGELVRREPHVTTYRPSPHVVCVADNPPKPKPEPTPEPTIPPSDTSTV
jgi:vancomycin resistance protein YoaR